MTENKKSYATINNPTMEAIVNNFFRLATVEQALDRINSIKETFITSRHQADADGQAILWIRGYGITPEEKKLGFIGNYAVITYEKNKEGKYIIKAEKLDSELKYHPQRKRNKQKHPNWGHPILRGIKKGRVYQTAEAARNELQKLHEEYPDISIPCTNKMYIIIYSGTMKPPVQKFVLEIKIAENDSGFYIDYEKNDYKPSKLPHHENKEEKPASTPQGYFTSMVQLKSKRAKPKPKAKPQELAEE